MKICLSCKEMRPLTEFHNYKKHSHRDGKKSYCKSCESKRYKKWRVSKLEELRYKDRVLYYTRKYNFSIEEAEAFLENRLGICEICKENSLLVVDHNHKTNKVRGFICSHCNSAIGYIRENIKICKNIILYLEKYNAPPS